MGFFSVSCSDEKPIDERSGKELLGTSREGTEDERTSENKELVVRHPQNVELKNLSCKNCAPG